MSESFLPEKFEMPKTAKKKSKKNPTAFWPSHLIFDPREPLLQRCLPKAGDFQAPALRHALQKIPGARRARDRSLHCNRSKNFGNFQKVAAKYIFALRGYLLIDALHLIQPHF